MRLSWVFYIIALILFLFAGIGLPSIPGALAFGLFCLTLGLILNDVKVPL